MSASRTDAILFYTYETWRQEVFIVNERRTDSNMSPVSTALETWLFVQLLTLRLQEGTIGVLGRRVLKKRRGGISKSQVVPKNSGAFAENIFAPNTLDL